MAATALYRDIDQLGQSEYYDRRSGLSQDDYKKRLTTSTTLYVGNLSFYTSESQLMELFSMCGRVKNLYMGLNNKSFRPCGFCFVEFQTREEASIAIDCLNLATMDRRKVRIDWDYGYNPNRRFGRGRGGGGVRSRRVAAG